MSEATLSIELVERGCGADRSKGATRAGFKSRQVARAM